MRLYEKAKFTIREASDFWDTSLLARNNAEMQFKGQLYRKKTIKATNPQFNQDNPNLGIMFGQKSGRGAAVRNKTIKFLNNGLLEHLILTRTNNMRAFYIETVRIFSVANRD